MGGGESYGVSHYLLGSFWSYRRYCGKRCVPLIFGILKIINSRRVIALWIFLVHFLFFCIYFLLANVTNSCLNVKDCNSYIYIFVNIHWTIVATTWRATKLETNNFNWWKQFVFLGTTYIKVEVWVGRYLFATTLNSKLFCFGSKLFHSFKNKTTQRKAIQK